MAGLGLSLLLAPAALAQRSAPPAPKAGAPAEKPAADKPTTAEKGTWSVRATRQTPQTFSVKAKDARVADITNELSRLLKIPIVLSPVMEKQRVTVDFSGMNLEGTVRLLAPQVFVDYAVGGEGQFEPKPLAIYLQALNERPPSPNESVKSNSEAILIEGDTEEGTGDEEAQRKRDEANPLKVSYVKNQLSVRARQQPLSVVLFKIASEVGIPFEMRYDSTEMVNVEFNNYTLEQAVRALSPSVRLFYRADLQNYDVQPLRLALLAPASSKSQE